MEIGSRLKNARNEHGLTQEQVAEELGVSRQSISNWENNRSYPDIISVIRMSDLYSVSLDELLKEDKNMIRHLAESTDAVASHKRLVKGIVIGVYAALILLMELFYWLVALPNGYSGDIIDMYAWLGWDVPRIGVEEFLFCFILPLFTGALFVIAGKNDYFGKRKWISVPVNGIVIMLVHAICGLLDFFIKWNTYFKFNIPDVYKEFDISAVFGEYFLQSFHWWFWRVIKALIAGMIAAATVLFIGSFIRHYRISKAAQMDDKAFLQENSPL